MHRPLILAFSLMAAYCPLTRAQERPPEPYDNWGVCPFECCTYREWTAEADIPVYASRNEQSAVLFRLRRDEQVRALTGVVVTEKAGALRIDTPVRDGYIQGSEDPQLSLKAGEFIYLLAPLGEGSYLFWYHGKTYRSGPGMAAMPQAGANASKMSWWKLVRNKAGQQGWTRSDRFANADACG